MSNQQNNGPVNPTIPNSESQMLISMLLMNFESQHGVKIDPVSTTYTLIQPRGNYQLGLELTNTPTSVQSLAITVAGTGGTPGTYPLVFSGADGTAPVGGETNTTGWDVDNTTGGHRVPVGTYTVDNSGAISATTMTFGGSTHISSQSVNVTVSLGGASGVTGATITATTAQDDVFNLRAYLNFTPTALFNLEPYQLEHVENTTNVIANIRQVCMGIVPKQDFPTFAATFWTSPPPPPPPMS